MSWVQQVHNAAQAVVARSLGCLCASDTVTEIPNFRVNFKKFKLNLNFEWSGGGPGVGARCGNGLFPTYKSPKFYLSFTILVSFILVKYPDRIGLVNTVPAVRYRTCGTVGTADSRQLVSRGAIRRRATPQV